MPERNNERTIFSLLEVSNSIARTLQERYSKVFWVQAEMNKLNHYQRSGHCYPELVEKRDGKVIAQMKATLWKEDYFRIDARFREILHEPLKDGIKILFMAKVTYDAVYGLSLWIMDIDPSYTLGDLEREKMETIRKLRAEGIFEKNATLPMPLLPQRIAIISVETSKGYADFMQVIEHNPYGYRFFHMLFPSLLQGDKAAPQIIAQLRRIRKVKQHFDVVAIIRGGGGDVGLSCYNDHALAKAICTFPLPVLTGVGHSTNETVAEMVSHTNAITPTQLGEILIRQFHQFAVPVEEARQLIGESARTLLNDAHRDLQYGGKSFRAAVRALLREQGYAVQTATHNLRSFSHKTLTQQQHRLALHAHTIRHLDPHQVLRRGYSITLHEGKVVTNAAQVQTGDLLVTQLAAGMVQSIVKKTRTKNE